ncbi:MFS transporter [Salinicola endophyticus]|uniref:MFS transporter n=1 Tax=Salinicola endophyticus TaxID=1949083 RepID=A0ABY8FCJ8_9GAMM|nr:MFS transporter [Salinicola endophyticus]WFF40272.1 MFS transporter [Salinicola endophyticus]
MTARNSSTRGGDNDSLTRLFESVTGDDDSRMCRDISDAACREQPGNFFRHLVAALGNKLADELSNARLILPWLMGAIGAPVWMVGLLVPIREAGALLPQLLIAGYIRLREIRKWVWVAGGVAQAVGAVLLGLLALFGHGSWGGALVLIALTGLSLGRGLSSVATKDVMGKTIAKQRRGTLMGWSASAAGALTLLVGIGLMLMGDRPGTWALAVLLFAAALGWALNALCAAAIREAPGATEGGANAWDSVKQGVSLLRRDRRFLHFNLSRALLLSSALALPYLALLGQQNSGTDLASLGILVLTSGVAGMIGGPIWGRLADRSSRRVMRNAAIGAALCCVAGAACVLLPEAARTSVWPYAVVYGLLMIAHAGIRLGRKTYVVDLSDSDTRALYVAFSNTFTGVLMLIVGLLLGVLAQWLGSAPLLLLLALLALAAAGSAHALAEVEA